MKFLVFIPILILSTAVFPQSSEVRSVKVNPDYTWRNSEYWARDSLYFDLPLVKNSIHKIHFRFYLPEQLIDLYSDDGTHFSGILTNETTQFGKEKKQWGEVSVPDKMFFQQIVLEDSIATRVAQMIIDSGQPEALTDAFIDNWNYNFLDCNQLRFHFKIEDRFRPQKYFCPGSQDRSITVVKMVLDNYQMLNNELNLGISFEEFLSKLPRGKTYQRFGRHFYLIPDKK